MSNDDDSFEMKYVGELKVGDVSRNYGDVTMVEIGSATNTIHFNNESVGVKVIRTWSKFHSVEVKKESK